MESDNCMNDEMTAWLFVEFRNCLNEIMMAWIYVEFADCTDANVAVLDKLSMNWIPR